MDFGDGSTFNGVNNAPISPVLFNVFYMSTGGYCEQELSSTWTVYNTYPVPFAAFDDSNC